LPTEDAGAEGDTRSREGGHHRKPLNLKVRAVGGPLFESPLGMRGSSDQPHHQGRSTHVCCVSSVPKRQNARIGIDSLSRDRHIAGTSSVSSTWAGTYGWFRVILPGRKRQKALAISEYTTANCEWQLSFETQLCSALPDMVKIRSGTS